MFTLQFGDYEFPNQTFEVDGLPHTQDVPEIDIPQRHGSVMQDSYLRSRKIKISGKIHNANKDTSYTQLLAMQAALLVKQDAPFRYLSDRYINARTRKLNPSFAPGTDKAVIDVDIELIAQDPFHYSDGLSYSDVENTDGTTKSFDLYNGGNAFSEPIFYICATGGTITDDINLINQSNGEQLKYRGTLNNGLTLIVDCAAGTVKNNAVSDMPNFEGDFVTIPAGTNVFAFVGATCRLTSEYRYRWT